MDYFCIIKGLIAEFPVYVLQVNHYAPSKFHVSLVEASTLSENQKKTIRRTIRDFFKFMVDEDIVVRIEIQGLTPLW